MSTRSIAAWLLATIVCAAPAGSLVLAARADMPHPSPPPAGARQAPPATEPPEQGAASRAEPGAVEPAEPAPAIPENGITLVTEPSAKEGAEGESHLVLMRDGNPVVDIPVQPPTVLPDGSEVAEDAVVAGDGSCAAVLRTRLRPSPAGELPAAGTSEIVWVRAGASPPVHTIPLEGSRSFRVAVALPGGRGLAVGTDDAQGEGELLVLGADGQTVYRMSGAEVTDLRTNPSGDVVVADLDEPYGETGADRGVLVLDLLTMGHWMYTWRYGEKDEPTGWAVEDSGALDVILPAGVRRFDRNGHPLGFHRRK